MKPRLLDLFCGAGGAAMGYHRAGFDVVGVDIKPQPNYPFEFYKGGALAFLEGLYLYSWTLVDGEFDAIHASPPCQAYSHAGLYASRRRADHPRLIAATRDLLTRTGLPYVIENVEDARRELIEPVMLCGSLVGLPDLERHRYFETNWPLLVPSHCQHGVRGRARFPGTTRADGSRPNSAIVNQMASGVTHQMLADAMGIDWLPAPGRKRPTPELCEAIPPAYTELIGHQLMSYLKAVAA